MKGWIISYIQYTLKHGKPFFKTSGWSIKLDGVISMSYYIKNKDGYYLAVQFQVTEDDYWEIADIDASMTTQAHWVIDPLDAKSFYDASEATDYKIYHRYRDCEVVRVRF